MVLAQLRHLVDRHTGSFLEAMLAGAFIPDQMRVLLYVQNMSC